MIGDDISSALPELQQHAESLMVDTCEIRERSTGSTYDPATNRETAVPGQVVYSGMCRARQVNAQQVVENAEQQVTTVPYRITLPWNTTGVEVDHLVTVTASSDPDLVGRQLTVVAIAGGSLRYQRLIICSDNQG